MKSQSDDVIANNHNIDNDGKSKKLIPPYMKTISGSFGGVVEACCLQPIDIIKTRLQLDRTVNLLQ
ncbi:hypothetical protein G4B88_010792 [Cannabis sativa]|uniref:Uncharacterized protein n=1 Tax=Cannabis sativa TaxID=3483 RepID=A0A7J6GDG3_CANSA|nr:hypothetical protein G4B88_010792 [Cannabis sativa]